MPMLPVCDILLIERKRCSCGVLHESVSPFRYRMFKACAGEPDKTEVRALKDFPSKSDEMADLVPMPDRAIAYHDKSIAYCPSCFTTTTTVEEARSIRPMAPAHTPGLTTIGAAMARYSPTKPQVRRPIPSLADL